MSGRAGFEHQLPASQPASELSRPVAALVLLFCAIAMTALAVGLGLLVSPGSS